jgi:hypothetical protein
LLQEDGETQTEGEWAAWGELAEVVEQYVYN